ncbi:MAG: aminodeoxychorismate synthase component I [Halanaerobium sp. MSAO_Bac5]|nr:MAG: aminodeoxychorismate synthase component I [Halanaerobium sp. MSAO_Bac5]
MLIKKLQTDLKPFEVFKIFAQEEQPIFLDSSDKYKKLGQYSIISFNPFLRMKSKNNKVLIEQDNKRIESKEPMKHLQNYLKKYQKNYQSDLPFIGGAVGHFSYDLCHHFEELPRTAVDDLNIPDLNLGFYNGGIVYNHQTEKYFITDAQINSNAKKRVETIIRKIKRAKIPKLKTKAAKKDIQIKSNLSKKEYFTAIDKLKKYIENGDIYQANMTQRFETELQEEPLVLYSKLREVNPAPFAAYLDFGDYQILSSSPERFIRCKNNKLFTRPIKGTRPRGKNKAEDMKLKKELINSEKDKAELLMIVDLERNDFSKIAKTGTVKVPELFVVEKYPTVFHLVSQVECELDEKYDAVACIKNTFPGGSITGAPKIRAMEIIDELEPTQRNIYTGSIGYLDFNGNMDLNIVIRTMLIKNKKVYFQVGGGIVWDSNAAAEYQESLDKGKALVEALKR